MQQLPVFCLCLLFPFWLLGQVPGDYPDTLWVYGNAQDPGYGLSPSKPIKVGGGKLPKSNYTYLRNLTDLDGNPIVFERLGSFDEPNGRAKPLTGFKIKPKNGNEWTTIYFDQYDWDYPKVISGFGWKENRKGYHGYFEQDTIFNGYGIYFFEDGGYYKGNWAHGEPNGTGIMYVADVELYTGDFENGVYQGYGVLEFLDGGRYEGYWKEGLKDGKGKVFYPPGDEINYIEGTFEKGEAVGVFEIYLTDGTKEEHDFGPRK